MLNPETGLCLGILTGLAVRLVRRLKREGPALFDLMTMQAMVWALVVLCWPTLFGPAGPPPLVWAMTGWCMEFVRLVLLAWVDGH
jgi:hypothetical protein